MFCPNCKGEIADNSVFCPKCGQNIQNAVNTADVSMSQSVENSDYSAPQSEVAPDVHSVPPTHGTPNMNVPTDGSIPGKGAAVASLVLGIISIVFWFFAVGSIVGLVTGIIGLVCASSAKKAGYEGGLRTGGFVCSLIGLIGSALVFVACVACAGVLGSAGAFDALGYLNM